MTRNGSPLLAIDGLVVEGYQDDAWRPIVDGVSLRLDRGEVLGLIGESGAGKSTIGIAAMGYVRTGCRIVGGKIAFDGEELTTASERTLRRLRGPRIAFVAQSAAASFNPAHRLIDQLVEIPVQHRRMREGGGPVHLHLDGQRPPGGHGRHGQGDAEQGCQHSDAGDADHALSLGAGCR